MICTTKGLSSTQTAKRYGITQKTSWMLMQKVKLAMKSSEKHPMKGNVQVDEFVVGGKETGKQGRSFDSKKSKVACINLTYLLNFDYERTIDITEITEKDILLFPFEINKSKKQTITQKEWLGEDFFIELLKQNKNFVTIQNAD